jgi:hypothetical protein
VVHWDAGSIRAYVPPGPSATTSDFTGDVGAVGIGPAGIVARVHSGIDFDAFVTSFIGPDWVGQLSRFELVDGVLHIATEDGRSADIDMAAEGLGPGDVSDRGHGWFSADGATWLPIPGFPPNVIDIVGVSDGFIARAIESIWHSADGMTWRQLDGFESTETEFLPWRGGAIEIGASGQAGEPVIWTSSGRRAFTMPTEAFPQAPYGQLSVGTGPLGLVAVGTSDVGYVAGDGSWSRGPMTEEMSASGGGRRRPRIVVGDGAVIVTLWSEAGVPSLWLGTPG